jgi:pyruvate,orthophosphate dikinase
VQPHIYAMQVRALFEAAAELRKRGIDAKPDVMIPGVGTPEEMRVTYDAAKAVADAVIAETGVPVPYRIGTMIELPRACVVADALAETAEFFSFGTNDLTQMGWGFSRDDVEGSFFSKYIEMGIFGVSPFETIDADGVGRLITIAVEEGRKARPGLKIGVCGEHGGDPDSVHFFHHAGLDYVSCSPFRVPVARLEAGRVVALDETGGSDSR